jgi:hypothetical protein
MYQKVSLTEINDEKCVHEEVYPFINTEGSSFEAISIWDNDGLINDKGHGNEVPGTFEY